jgi:phage terminase Nu1 subunit (DNA packaging protein)
MFEAGPTVFAFVKYVYSTRSKGSSASSSIDAEKLRLTKAQADMAEYKAATQRGELHEGEDVRRVLSDMLVRFRSRILSMPTKIAGMVQGRELAEAEAIVRDLCREALQELSEYNPSMFFKARANGESEETEGADSDD